MCDNYTASGYVSTVLRLLKKEKWKNKIDNT